MTSLLFSVFALLLFLLFGVVCIFWAEKVQQFYLTATGDSPFLFFMKSRVYTWFVRFFGLMAVLASTIVLFLIVRELFK
jgi:hypothetical protein